MIIIYNVKHSFDVNYAVSIIGLGIVARLKSPLAILPPIYFIIAPAIENNFVSSSEFI